MDELTFEQKVAVKAAVVHYLNEAAGKELVKRIHDPARGVDVDFLVSLGQSLQLEIEGAVISEPVLAESL